METVATLNHYQSFACVGYPQGNLSWPTLQGQLLSVAKNSSLVKCTSSTVVRHLDFGGGAVADLIPKIAQSFKSTFTLITMPYSWQTEDTTLCNTECNLR